MANNISQWSGTDASNNTGSAPDFPVEGQSPSSVNDTMRTIYGAVARWYQDTNGSLTTGGTSNAYTLTTNSTHAALADQSTLVFIANHSNTGAATLNVDSLGAKSIELGGAALASGTIVADSVIVVVYNATNDTYDLIGGYLPIIDTANLAADSVTNAKIADDAVNTAQLADGAVNTARLANDAVTYAKMQDVSATDKILGRETAGSGVVEEIDCTSAGRALLDDASASAQRTTLGLGTMATRNVTVSTSSPSGGSDGDLWFKREA